MTCLNCKQESTRVVIRSSGSYCSKCSSISEMAGATLSGIVTQSSYRIRNQQEKHRGDVVIPHSYDKASGKMIPNPEFVKLYPEQTSQFFDESDIKQTGDKKLEKLWQKQEAGKAAQQEQIDTLAHGAENAPGDKEKQEQFIEDL